MQWSKRVLTVAVAALVVAGCDFELHPGWESSVEPDGPLHLQEGAVYLDTEFEQVVLLRPGIESDEPQLEVERHSTATNPATMEASSDGESLYVINRGEREGEQSLSIFDIGEDSVEREDVALDSYYDRITVDPDGEFVLLSSTGEDERAVAQNLHAMAIVDLREDLPEEADVTTLRRVPRNIEFLPPFEMGGETHRLAVVTATNSVEVVDLEAQQQDAASYRAPLTITETQQFVPTDVVFDPPSTQEGGAQQSEQASLFVLADGQPEVTQIQMQTPLDGDSDRSLELSINQLAAGDNPGHIEVLDLGEGNKRLLALDANSPEFTLVDVASQESATYSLPTGNPATGMEVFQVPRTDGEGGSETRVLVYSRNSKLVAVVRPENIALGDQDHSLGQAVQEIRLESPPSAVEMGEDAQNDRALVLHAGGNDGFTVLKLDQNRAVSWTGSNLSSVQFDGQFAYGIYATAPYLERINVESDRSTRIPLREHATDLYVKPGTVAVMVRHPGESGRFSVLNGFTLEPEDGRLYEQIFLGGVLDRPARERQEEDDE